MINEFDATKIVDFSDDPDYPCRAQLWDGELALGKRDGQSTYYGYAVDATTIATDRGQHRILAGMYFCVPGWVTIMGGFGVVIERMAYKGLFSIGGPIEDRGRLRYIDGCTDTQLIGPPRKGDPCLNHLHFPPGISQTMHTHPTVRIGIVARGRGRCVTPDNERPLVPGIGWFLPVEGAHCFFTDNESMDVIAWHPDTDTGPSDEDHPMLNRTYVDDVSAREIDAIRTTEGTEIAS